VRKKFTLSRSVPSARQGRVRFTDPPELRGVTLLSINPVRADGPASGFTPPPRNACAASRRANDPSVSPVATSPMRISPIGHSTISRISHYPLRIISRIIRLSDISHTSGSGTFTIQIHLLLGGQDVPCILHAEMYDQDGRKIRENACQRTEERGRDLGRTEDGNAFVAGRHEIGPDD